MSVRENLKLIRARYDAVNEHDLDRFQGFYGDSIVWSDPGLRAAVKGPRAVRNRLKALTTAFRDLRWELDSIFGQGEYVCALFTFTGTHTGVLPDNRGGKIPATNRAVRIQAVGVYTIRDGRIVDSRIYFDFGSLISQIRE